MTIHVCRAADRAVPRTDEGDARDLLDPYVSGSLFVYDDGSEDRMWDFCLVDDNGGHAATVEVTRTASQAQIEFEHRLDETGRIWDLPGIGSSWSVLLPETTNPHKVDQTALFEMLCEFTNLGLQRVTDSDLKPRRDGLQNQGIRALIRRTGADVDQAHIYMMDRGWTGSHNVADHLFAEAEANKRKLADAPTPRMLFVWIDWSDQAATFEMADPPGDLPNKLPDWVDVAWAACGEWSLDRVALWRTVNGEPWEAVQQLP